LAAERAVRRMPDAVARSIGHAGLPGLDFEPQDGPRAPAVLPVAERVGAELVVFEEQGEARLRHLDRAELDATGRLPLSRRLPAVARRRGAPARPSVEEVPDELAPRARIDALDGDAEAPPPARDDAVGTRLRERLDDGLRDLLRAVVGGQRHRR